MHVQNELNSNTVNKIKLYNFCQSFNIAEFFLCAFSIDTCRKILFGSDICISKVNVFRTS